MFIFIFILIFHFALYTLAWHELRGKKRRPGFVVKLLLTVE